MIRCRRAGLEGAGAVGPLAHPGLGLERYLPARGPDVRERDWPEGDPVRTLLQRASASSAPAAYAHAFQRWRRLATARPDTVVFSGRLATPLAIGLGEESALEVGLTLHHTYGMPVLPGTALKGAVRAAARRLGPAALSTAQAEAIFGGQESAGYCTFWDAWYDPGTVEGRPFKPDVVTVHHPDYYRKQGRRDTQGEPWPTDFDDPNPVPFLVVRPGAGFLLAVEGPDPSWARFAAQLVRWTLVQAGIGGKTNADYGRFAEEGWTGLDGAGSLPTGKQSSFAPEATESQASPAPVGERAATLDVELSGCRVEQINLRGGGVRGRFRFPLEEPPAEAPPGPRLDHVLEQREWQALTATLTSSQREALRRNRLRATVLVRQQGELLHFVKVVQWMVVSNA